MFGIGFPEILMILLVALLVVGPSKLPEIARSLGKGLGELKNVLNGAESSVKEAFYQEESYSSIDKENKNRVGKDRENKEDEKRS